jgi:hypothetical protein
MTMNVRIPLGSDRDIELIKDSCVKIDNGIVDNLKDQIAEIRWYSDQIKNSHDPKTERDF